MPIVCAVDSQMPAHSDTGGGGDLPSAVVFADMLTARKLTKLRGPPDQRSRLQDEARAHPTAGGPHAAGTMQQLSPQAGRALGSCPS